jgi:hypothetical protein
MLWWTGGNRGMISVQRQPAFSGRYRAGLGLPGSRVVTYIVRRGAALVGLGIVARCTRGGGAVATALGQFEDVISLGQERGLSSPARKWPRVVATRRPSTSLPSNGLNRPGFPEASFREKMESWQKPHRSRRRA